MIGEIELKRIGEGYNEVFNKMQEVIIKKDKELILSNQMYFKSATLNIQLLEYITQNKHISELTKSEIADIVALNK